MNTRKKVASVAFTGAATALAAGMTGMTAHASAGGKWFVKNNGVLYKGAVKAKVKAGTKTTLTDKAKNLTLVCSTAVTGGSAPKSVVSGPNPHIMGHLNGASTSWKNCTLLGLTFTARLTTNPNILASAYNSVTGTTTGKIGGAAGAIKATIKGVNNACSGTVSGASVPLSYINKSRQFNINPAKKVTLKITKAVNCPFAAGDSASFNGEYTASVPAGLSILDP